MSSDVSPVARIALELVGLYVAVLVGLLLEWVVLSLLGGYTVDLDSFAFAFRFLVLFAVGGAVVSTLGVELFRRWFGRV